MKPVLLLFILIFSFHCVKAQVNTLPVGKYETSLREKGAKWEKGDIHIINERHYKISGSVESGVYKFSATAQRIFFTSGPLKGFFAKTVQQDNAIAIVIPVTENEQLGYNIAVADVWGYLKQ